MHYKYYIVFNGQTNIDTGVLIKTRPSKPSPTMKYEEIEAPGRDGLLYKEKGYGDIDISISFNFVSKTPEKWDKDFRKVKKWLLGNEDKNLKFSDDLEVFYKVNKVTIETPERVMKRLGRFTVTFTCEPYVYLEDGKDEINLTNNIYNYNETSKPIYLIYGEGYLNLNVNGKVINVNVGQKIIIDTNLGLCFREDGSINNVALKGMYKDLYLKEGENTFSWTGSFQIKIIPNWRCL